MVVYGQDKLDEISMSAAFINTAFRFGPFSPFKIASVIFAFSSGVPPRSSSFVQPSANKPEVEL